MKFDDLIHVQHRPKVAVAADRSPVGTVEVIEELRGGNNDRFIGSLFNRRKAAHTVATRRRFLKGTLAAASATAAATAAVLGPAKEVFAVDGPVTSEGPYQYRILSKCAAAYASHNCTPGCGSTPVCNAQNCCDSNGYYRDAPGNGFILVPGICISGGVVGDGWLWTYQVGNGPNDGPCAHCVTIQYRCHDGAYQTASGDWVTSICRYETLCDNTPIPAATPAPVPTAAPTQPTLAPIPTPMPCSAVGTIESITDDSGGQVTITGWAKGIASGPINVQIEVDGVSTAIAPANVYRPDIQSTVAGAGTHHGYVVHLTGVAPGTREFCVYALENTCRLRLTCLALTVTEGGTAPGPTPVPTTAATPVPRPTTPAGRPTATPVPPATAVPAPTAGPRPTAAPQPTAVPPQPAPTPAPLPPGSLPPLSSATPHRPVGSVDVLQAGRDSGAFASGWAGDADSRLPTYVVATIDGVDVAQTSTSLTRSDVGRAFPHMGPNTGWTLSIPYATSGTHKVCIHVVDAQDGRRFLLGCRNVTSTANSAQTTSAQSGAAQASVARVGGRGETVEATTAGS